MFLIISIIFFSIIFSYFIGSIPTGFWFVKYFFGVDVTKNGSGNIGATNVARVLQSKKYFFLIFFIDFLKAFLALFWVNLFLQNSVSLDSKILILVFCASFLLLGNAYSIFLKFKGGKGVATTAGILAFLFPLNLFIFFIVSWSLILFFMKRIDIASVASLYLLILYYCLFSAKISILLFIFFVLNCFWVTYRHKNNFIKR